MVSADTAVQMHGAVVRAGTAVQRQKSNGACRYSSTKYEATGLSQCRCSSMKQLGNMHSVTMHGTTLLPAASIVPSTPAGMQWAGRRRGSGGGVCGLRVS
jgi:hypothetical protein